MTQWPFDDPPNVAVFTSRLILDGSEWVQFVTHDEEDGAWQFHPRRGTPMEEAFVVGLKEVVLHDPSVMALADLPLGWCAWRETRDAPWSRAPKPRAEA